MDRRPLHRPGHFGREAAVVEWFATYEVEDFARMGSIATMDIFLPMGPLVGFQVRGAFGAASLMC